MEPPSASGAASLLNAVQRGHRWGKAGMLFAAHQPVAPVSVEWTPVADRLQASHLLVVRLKVDAVRRSECPFARFKPPVLPRDPAPVFAGVSSARPAFEREEEHLVIEGSFRLGVADSEVPAPTRDHRIEVLDEVLLGPRPHTPDRPTKLCGLLRERSFARRYPRGEGPAPLSDKWSLPAAARAVIETC